MKEPAIPARKRRSKSLPGNPDRPLTQLQRRFIEILSQDPQHNLARAAREAGYKGNVRNIGWSLMNEAENAHVQAAYKRLADERFNEFATVTDAQVYHLVQVLAFGDRRRLMKLRDGEPAFKDPEELWPEEAWLIDSYRTVALNDGSGDTVVIPQTVDRMAAVQLLAKMKGLTLERHQHDTGPSLDEARNSIKSALAKLAAPGFSGPLDQRAEPGGAESP